MSKPAFKRAHHPEQKEQRRKQIMRAASDLLAAEGFEAVSLNAIARSVGIAKSNVYRYFESREDIFLQLLEADFSEWIGDVEGRLSVLAGGGDARAVARAMAASCASRPRTCLLLSVLAAVLEQNASEESLRAFKLNTVGLGVRLANAMHAALPGLSMPNCVATLKPLFALVAGLWPTTQYSETMSRVMEDPRLAIYQGSFEQDLTDALHMLLLGARARSTS